MQEQSSIRWFARALLIATAVVVGGRAIEVKAQGPCDPQWLPGEGVPGVQGIVYATVRFDPDGPGPFQTCLVAAGRIDVAGKEFVGNIAFWDDGTQRWHPMGLGLTLSSNNPCTVYSLALMPNGDLIAAGAFDRSGGLSTPYVARWDVLAGEWRAMGSGPGSTVYSLGFLPTGELLACVANGVRKWVPANSTWAMLIPVNSGSLRTMLPLSNGHVIVAGRFTAVNGIPTPNISIRDTVASQWIAMGTGTNDDVLSLIALPGGDVVAGGEFTTAGGVSAAGVARWDGATWTSLGSGVSGPATPDDVRALALLPNGQLVIAGNFAFAGGIASNCIARWNLQTEEWVPCVVGLNSSAESLRVDPNGAVIVGGRFWQAGGIGARGLVSWEPVTDQWLGFGQGLDSSIHALVATPSGEVIAGGTFAPSGGAGTSYIARWQPGVPGWSSLGGGLDGPVRAIVELPDGTVVAGGAFTHSGATSVPYVGRWESTQGQWSSLGIGVSNIVNDVQLLPNGDLAVGGSFSAAGGMTARYLAQWSAVLEAWSPLAPGLNTVVETVLPMPNGDVIVGGYFTMAGGLTVNRVARWNATTSQWTSMGSGMDDSVYTLAALPNGEIVAGGIFGTAGGVLARRIARWNPVTEVWSPMGPGLSGGSPSSYVNRVEVLPNGDVIAGGNFASAGTVTVNNIARWSSASSQWQPFGTGTSGAVNCLASLPHGELGVGGAFAQAGNHVSARFARWTDNPSPWVAIQPQPQAIDPDETVMLAATPATAYSNVSYQWKRNGVDIADGTGGASSGGGMVFGASGTLPSPTNGQPALLTIGGAQSSDSGQYTVLFFNACGEALSQSATVSVGTPCPADFDGNGTREVPDIFAFLSAWFAMDVRADFDGVGGIAVPDIFAFLSAWFAGCP